VSDGQDEFGRLLKKVRRRLENAEPARRDEPWVIRVDKRTHRIRFEEETEEEVTVVVERKDDRK
jgi:hypothetical protein